MADKSPRHSMSKKSGKSLKQKRSDRKAKAAAAGPGTAGTEKLAPTKKH